MTEITLSGYSDTTENVVTATSALVDGDKYIIPTTDSKGNQLVGNADGSIQWILATESNSIGGFHYSVIDNSDSSQSTPVRFSIQSVNIPVGKDIIGSMVG